MSIEQQIVEWASSRPPWQRAVLRRIARGDRLLNQDFEEIADRITNDLSGGNGQFVVEDMPTRTAQGPCVNLVAIQDAKNVNALVQDTPLTFEPSGLTVVYGDNGSGKSGYARLIKQMVRARHSEPILTDVFKDPGTSVPYAKISVLVNDQKTDLTWPQEAAAELAQVSFYDEACGHAYITAESEVTYRPSALFVLDGLIRVCDSVREELNDRIAKLESSAETLPTLPVGTKAARLLESLSAYTTIEEISAASQVPTDVDIVIGRLATEEARLRATDPCKEKSRLQNLASKLARLAGHFEECERTLGTVAIDHLREFYDDLKRKKAAAAIASDKTFDDEPVAGVGSEVWRELWESARRFAAEAWPGQPFPYTNDGSRCPLCQQELLDEAADRLRRFDAFIQDNTQQELEKAADVLGKACDAIKFFNPLPADVTLTLADTEVTHSSLAVEYRRAVECFGTRLKELLATLDGESWIEPSTHPPKLAIDVRQLSIDAQSTADKLDETTFTDKLKRTTDSRLELEAVKELGRARETVEKEVHRLKILTKLNSAKGSTDTQWTSKTSADLTREYVTTVVRDRFTRESDRLKLERVTIQDIGGRKGTLHHQPAFVGAVQRVEMPKVLSEGEQTALGLAGFFTEVHFDSSKSAIILDDPVSSLDHVRRGYVAGRLAQLAKERQVVVFTHDIAFVTELHAACEREGVSFVERSVERRLSGEPGSCKSVHPWNAKDVSQRLHSLEQDLVRIRRESPNWDQATYERETADWAGRLSETWERAINLEVVGHVVDRGTLEVRPKMFRILARITADDDAQFQSGYAQCSRWARRHDKSVELNYVPPSIDEIQKALNSIRDWFNRVRKYRN